MSTHRVQNIVISADTALVAGALAVNTTNISTQGTLAIAGSNNVTLGAGATISDSETLQLFNYITGNASLRRSMAIQGRKVTKFEAQAYAPATRKVVAIGYNRKTAAGSIPVAASTEYQMLVHVKSDKQLYSDLNLNFTLLFTSAATATQTSIATQIVSALNGVTGSGSYLSRMLVAKKVGDGTGIDGLTGASNFGVEVTGLVPAQAVGSYAIEIPDFDILTNTLSGWGQGFAPTVISNAFIGNGSLQQITNLEQFMLGAEGQMNRTLWPIPVQNTTVSTTANLSATIAGTGNVGTTISSDLVTFATTNASLVPGDLITLDAVNHEVKYLIGTTQAVLVAVATATAATATLKKRGFYSVIAIEFSNPNLYDGAGVTADNKQSVLIAVPAFTTAAAYNATSTSALSILGVLNPYMNSLGFGSISL